MTTAVLLAGLIVIAALGEALRRARRAARQFAAAARHWKTIVDHVPHMVWTASSDGAPTYLSPLHAELIDELGDRSPHAVLLDAIHPEFRKPIEDAWFASVASGRPFEFPYRLRDRQGEYRWLVSKGNSVKDPEGRVVMWVGSNSDVTSYKQLEDELRRTLGLLDRAVQASKIFLWEFDLVEGELDDTRVVLVNYYESLGVVPTTPLRRGWLLATVHPEDQAALHAATLAVIAGDVPEFAVEYRTFGRDGDVRYHLARGVVARSATGLPLRFMGSTTDISELKRAQTHSQLATERLHRAVESSEMSIWEFELSPTRDWRVGVGLVVAPADQQRVIDALDACIQGRAPTVQIDYQAAGYMDSSVHWRLVRGTVTRAVDGTPLRLIGTSIDITDAKRTQLELQRAKERLDLLIHNAKLSPFEIAIPPDGLDAGVAQITNTTASFGAELPTMPAAAMMSTLVHPDDQARVWSGMTASVHSGSGQYECECRLVHLDGSVRWVLARATTLRDDQGRPNRLLGIAADITELKRAEADLQTAKDAAERANRAKDEFLANVSHEIRTPMNAILALTELALDSSLTEHQRKLLTTVKSAADSLLGIINDLLDFSKIEAGKIELDHRELSLRVLLEDTLPALVIRAQHKGLALTWHVDPDIPDALIGDLGRLRQVLINLVGNAVKFTHEGAVRVEVGRSPEPAAGDALAVQLTVRDTGVGIPLDKQEQIFRAFEQEDSSTTRRYGGTGLGLTIAAKLVGLMGGAITVESSPGRGSSFTATVQMKLPPRRDRSAGRAPPPSSPWPARLAPPVQSLQILVAEDNELNVSVLEELFAQRGHRGHFARDGRCALALATSAEFDVMLLDIHMPELDGFDVAHAIRASERGAGRHLPIVAFTARSSLQHRERCLAAGMDDFLAKPVDAQTLWATIERLTASAPSSAPSRLLDLAAIGRACGRDRANLEQLCEVFVRSVPLQLGSVRSALDTRNIERLRDTAHALHGTLAAFSEVAGAAASDLEELATRGMLDDCWPRFHQVQTLCQDVVEEARTLSIEQVVQAEARW